MAQVRGHWKWFLCLMHLQQKLQSYDCCSMVTPRNRYATCLVTPYLDSLYLADLRSMKTSGQSSKILMPTSKEELQESYQAKIAKKTYNHQGTLLSLHIQNNLDTQNSAHLVGTQHCNYVWATGHVSARGHLQRKELPCMNHYPGVNSVLVCKNAKIHQGHWVQQLCDQAGVLLAEYCPQLNPIVFGSSAPPLQIYVPETHKN
ncbi:hypothetical protein VP01_629g7 [Puccinia sorghi]|uniref:Uncharacterized protein n=1 Tax=Puccinia sorghi TaxID=27349 RepID=A0A0L6UH41_9BASI|nr:hypothetical protein VP01_629g7 [Puccinia sorghi]